MSTSASSSLHRSRIRKRPVSFGNPALGTYKGFVYTLEVNEKDKENENSDANANENENSNENENANANANTRNGAVGVPVPVPVPIPVVEGAAAVDRMVAMVHVPPEQVPEGILHLARSHRTSIEHVRIVIAEPEPEHHDNDDDDDDDSGDDIENETENKTEGDTHTGTTAAAAATAATATASGLLSVSVSAMEAAASIVATEGGELVEDKREDAADPSATSGTGTTDSAAPSSQHRPDAPNILEGEVDEEERPSRTYLVLLQLCSEEAARMLVEDLNGRPYTSLDETVTCSVHTVLALQGEGGVSLLNPLFAPSTKKAAQGQGGALEILPNPSSADENKATAPATATTSTVVEDKKLTIIGTSSTSTSTSTSTVTTISQGTTTSTAVATTAPSLTEDPNCAVCLEHMSLDPNSDDKTSILTTVCNHTFHLECLVQCQDSPCPVCRYDHSGLNETLSQCLVCGTTDRNYVCLICGVVSCVGGPMATSSSSTMGSSSIPSHRTYTPFGSHCVATTSAGHGAGHAATAPPESSSSSVLLLDPNPSPRGTTEESNEHTARRFYTSHAGQHYDETLHAYALDTETQHVWDFAGQGYVHRLLQNKEDGKLVEVHDPNNTTSQVRSLTPGLSDAQEGEVVHRKLEGFASQYYTLLKSQLEQQRTFYEGRLEEIRREFATKQSNAAIDKADLMVALKQEKKQLAQRVVSLKRKNNKVTENVGFLKSMNESLEANKTPLERKIKQAQREQIESREMVQKYLPALEEKVTTLMLQLEESLTSKDPSTGGAATPNGATSSASSTARECAPHKKAYHSIA